MDNMAFNMDYMCLFSGSGQLIAEQMSTTIEQYLSLKIPSLIDVNCLLVGQEVTGAGCSLDIKILQSNFNSTFYYTIC